MHVANTVLVLAVLAAVSGGAFAQETTGATHRGKVVLILQDYDQASDCYDWLSNSTKPCGILIDALLSLDERNYRQQMATQFQAIVRELPELDLPKATRAAFCSELAATADACVGPVLAQSGKPPLRLDAGTLLVRASIRFYHEGKRRGLRVIATPHRVGNDGTPAPPAFHAWYDTRTPSDLRGDPLSDPESRAHWLEGDPPMLESELQQAMIDTASLLRTMLEHHAETRTAEFQRWWSELPTLKGLRDAGTLECRGMECRSRYLAVRGPRVWYAPETGGVPVLSSVPLVDFRR